jgi:hypothetical protein
MVYKLVTRGTVEERIVERAKQKMLLDRVSAGPMCLLVPLTSA